MTRICYHRSLTLLNEKNTCKACCNGGCECFLFGFHTCYMPCSVLQNQKCNVGNPYDNHMDYLRYIYFTCTLFRDILRSLRKGGYVWNGFYQLMYMYYSGCTAWLVRI